VEGGLTNMKVWVNGSFDILHIGHIRLLEHARSFGDVRVGLDTDERIQQKKGENRPVNSLQDRMDFISSIRFVNDVVSFGSDDELIYSIKEYKPDLMVIGNDYDYHSIIGIEHIPKVEFFRKIENKSTTKILNHENFSNWRKVF
jgi:D-beta-D-heptose 7-phosphate kinase/D-beta-D-heptose 1-phosphate adenosyltransferase